MSTEISHKHHYLPESYLAGFTPSGKKGDNLFSFDLCWDKPAKLWSTAAVAWQYDWHSVDFPGLPPDFVEKNLGELVEQSAAETIVRVTAQMSYSAEDLTCMLNLLALTIVRVPTFRDAMILRLEQKTGMSLSEASADTKNWSLIAKWLEEVVDEWTEKHTRSFLAAKHPCATDRNWLFFSMIMAQDTFLKLLANRSWSLFVADNDASDFICSDDPMRIFHSPPVSPYRTPSFQEPDTVITFPLNRRVCLVGQFEREATVGYVGEHTVANINLGTSVNASRYLYAF